MYILWWFITCKFLQDTYSVYVHECAILFYSLEYEHNNVVIFYFLGREYNNVVIDLISLIVEISYNRKSKLMMHHISKVEVEVFDFISMNQVLSERRVNFTLNLLTLKVQFTRSLKVIIGCMIHHQT